MHMNEVQAHFLSRAMEFFNMLKKIGSDDPRRIVHAFKVALGLTLVSTFYYVNPVFDGLGQPVMWAVLTVVLVMEFTVGAVISKGLNRAIGTFLAGVLGVGAHRFATLFGERGEPVVLGIIVFAVAASVTFARFVPRFKVRCDYGMVIFILTFCLVAVSSYRKAEVAMLAAERAYTIVIGVVISFLVSVLVFPAWAGEDLHRMVVGNLEKLADATGALGEALGGKRGSILLDGGHRGLLHSKSAEDSLASLVWWEPPHGRFRFRHPWEQYRKLGEEGLQCAYLIEAFNAHLRQTSGKVELDDRLLRACTELSSESCGALREIVSAIRSMAVPSPAARDRVAAASLSAERMKTSLLEDCDDDVEGMLRAAPVVSALIEIFNRVQALVGMAEELAQRARFESSGGASKDVTKTVPDAAGFDHVTFVVEE